MSRREFELLLRRKLAEAVQLAESKLGHPLAQQVGIPRDSPGANGRRISIEEAAAELFVSETCFYLAIDLAVVEVAPTKTWVWARESGHPPRAFEDTWNQPPGSGPFKHLLSDHIRASGET